MSNFLCDFFLKIAMQIVFAADRRCHSRLPTSPIGDLKPPIPTDLKSLILDIP